MWIGDAHALVEDVEETRANGRGTIVSYIHTFCNVSIKEQELLLIHQYHETNVTGDSLHLHLFPGRLGKQTSSKLGPEGPRYMALNVRITQRRHEALINSKQFRSAYPKYCTHQ
jgi:hypothetical protein